MVSDKIVSITDLQQRQGSSRSSTARLLQDGSKLLSGDRADSEKSRGNESSGLSCLSGLREISLLYRRDIVESLARCNKLLCGLLEQPARHDELAIQALKKVITEIEWILPPHYMRQLLMLNHEHLSALSGPVAELAMNLRTADRLLRERAENGGKPEIALSARNNHLTKG